MSCDTQRLAMDYHIIGIRECAAEVSRYLVAIEGMDLEDPLRIRLMSHLQYYAQQREVSGKVSSSSCWPATPYQTNSLSATAYQTYMQQPTACNTYTSQIPHTVHSYSTTNTLTNSSPTSIQTNVDHPNGTVVNISTPIQSVSLNPQQIQQSRTERAHHDPQAQNHGPQQSVQHPEYSSDQTQEHQNVSYMEMNSNNQRNLSTASAVSFDNLSHYSTNNTISYSASGGALNYIGTSGSKPYRPWGTEMAY